MFVGFSWWRNHCFRHASLVTAVTVEFCWLVQNHRPLAACKSPFPQIAKRAQSLQFSGFRYSTRSIVLDHSEIMYASSHWESKCCKWFGDFDRIKSRCFSYRFVMNRSSSSGARQGHLAASSRCGFKKALCMALPIKRGQCMTMTMLLISGRKSHEITGPFWWPPDLPSLYIARLLMAYHGALSGRGINTSPRIKYLDTDQVCMRRSIPLPLQAFHGSFKKHHL